MFRGAGVLYWGVVLCVVGRVVVVGGADVVEVVGEPVGNAGGWLRRCSRLAVFAARYAEFNLDSDRVVGDVRLFPAAVVLEMDDVVLGQEVQVVVHVVDVTVKATG